MCVAAEKRRADLAPADQRSDLLVLLCVRCGFSGRVSFGRAGFRCLVGALDLFGFFSNRGIWLLFYRRLRVRLRSFVEA